MQNLRINEGGQRDSVLYVLNAKDLETIIKGYVSEVETQREINKRETYLSPEDAAQRLGVTKSTLWRWNKGGILKPVKTGKTCRYKESDIVKLMEG